MIQCEKGIADLAGNVRASGQGKGSGFTRFNSKFFRIVLGTTLYIAPESTRNSTFNRFDGSAGLMTVALI
jgi:hypothetical protein